MPRQSEAKSNERWFWASTIGGMVAIAALFWIIDLKSIYEHAQRMNGLVVFGLLAVLPLVGAPVSILFAMTGAKFGVGWGLMLAALAIAFHLVASWWIAHSWFKRPLESVLQKMGRRRPQLPPGDYIPVCLLIALIPGLSYALKNYLLVLGEAPFKKYFWTCLPAHFFHASLALLFGHSTGSMTTPRIVFLSAYAVLLIGLSHYVVRRLKRRKQFVEV